MRVHLLGLPHTQVTRAFDWCAYTAKIRRLSDMLVSQGHDPVTYCGAGFDGSGEHVQVVDDDDLVRWFGGPWDTAKVFDRWNPDDPCWVEMNVATVKAIGDRLGPHDVIGVTMGRCQQAVADAFPGQVIAEVGIGYEGVLEGAHHCFESSAWRHYVYGRNNWNDGRHFDTVIPNAFDPADYKLGDDQGYLLFLGRHTPRKGLTIVAELAKTRRVVTAGQDGPIPGVEYLGVVLGDDKRDLLAHASAVLVPTLYVEPFGGVAVEAMMSGVPAITTDFGAFVETVDPRFRCNTLEEFRRAITRASDYRNKWTRDRAIDRFSTDAVAGQYDRWLRRLGLLYGDGWYSNHGR